MNLLGLTLIGWVALLGAGAAFIADVFLERRDWALRYLTVTLLFLLLDLGAPPHLVPLGVVLHGMVVGAGLAIVIIPPLHTVARYLARRARKRVD